MTARSCQGILLAAGEGTRMNSSRSKVLHTIAGLPMIGHVLRAMGASGTDRVAIVVGPDADDVGQFVTNEAPGTQIYTQSERLGTAHAVLAARGALKEPADDVLVLYGDTPLISPDTLQRMRAALADGADLVVLGFRAANPSGYGRLVTDGPNLRAIREERDATASERAIDLCNAGAMAFRGDTMVPMLDRIGSNNAKNEFYLTDSVEIANADGKRVVVVEASEDEARGVNTRAELAAVERLWQQRRRAEAMADGVGLVAPETVYFAYDTVIGRDVLIEPNVVFGPGVIIGDGSEIHAFSHITGAHIHTAASVGPFARLRPGATISDNARVGNFCEIKNAIIGNGAKVNHLSYIGDASVGASANIGAGTITCNYDGRAKHRTDIGEGSFIGSNSALVAPLKIGDNAYVASGSVITEDVEDGALAVARGRQATKPGWVSRFRQRQ